MTLIDRLGEIVDAGVFRISDKKPSEWAAERMKFTEGRFPGPLSFDLSPFLVEPLDCMSPYHPAVEVCFTGPAQVGKTKLIIEALILYYMSEHGCNMGYLTGHTDLSDESMADLDMAIENAKMQYLIMPKVHKARNSKTGDTSKAKEFAGGTLTAGSITVHKLLRRRNWRVIICDDIDAGKLGSKESGATVSLVRERGKSYGNKKKILWISTAEVRALSMIWPLFLEGDQRYWYWACPCCSTAITLEWEKEVPGTKDKAGIYFKRDSLGRPVPGSLVYVCEHCGNGFTEKNKYELNKGGLWLPHCEDPLNPEMASFKFNGLYAPPGMDDWYVIAHAWCMANPLTGGRDELKFQTWQNLKIGDPYDPPAETTSATQIMKNQRPYSPGTVPEKLSIADGNGQIVLVTCEADCNGVQDDARIDFEVVAHSETGATYSVLHGSVGTFVPRENALVEKEDRKRWTYHHNKPNSVWPVYDRIIRQVIMGDMGTPFQLYTPGVDTGAYSELVHEYMDWTKVHHPLNPCVGMRGDKEEKFIQVGANMTWFQVGKHRKDVFHLRVGLYKDNLNSFMKLEWRQGDGPQPPNFMNYPAGTANPLRALEPEAIGPEFLYQKETFFDHYEAEEKKLVKNADGSSVFRWEKKNQLVQNHLFDCRVYNMAKRDIIVWQVQQAVDKEAKFWTWADFVRYVTS